MFITDNNLAYVQPAFIRDKQHYVCSENALILAQVKSRKPKYFGHVTRHNSLEKGIMLGTMPGKRRQGGQKKQWLDDITQWASGQLGQSLVDMVRLAEDRVRCRRFAHAH